ncbi:hypothetical protein C8N35_106115 [Breoghania corrubedonensis]|uniref:DUF1134 domain-containing protein n=1 Tax=Breoghania corrubedonensis TaxID=665038 RepID=A0A2T5V7L7_9HYPH|nr:DUF1134 domain-containing protein [Breoghania corrubedonensis]PTW59730.1 hypothetical protein C8N35_106115 [Breoghania corrubedonensis]
MFLPIRKMVTRLSAPALFAAAILAAALAPATSQAQATYGDNAPPGSESYSQDEVVDAGHRFFGKAAGGLASVVENAVSKYGQPNGYILGEEGSGAIVAGARYGEGELYTRNAGNHKVFWQGPSIGWDFGGDGARVMMLVYNLPSVDAIFRRYVGVNGSAYLVGGFGMTVLSNNEIYVVPIRAGVGARLGINVGYLKFTNKPTWNPF